MSYISSAIFTTIVMTIFFIPLLFLIGDHPLYLLILIGYISGLIVIDIILPLMIMRDTDGGYW